MNKLSEAEDFILNISKVILMLLLFVNRLMMNLKPNYQKGQNLMVPWGNILIIQVCLK
jgi:hypothetical protein